ncbi:MAG: hypothetical protein HC854_15145 [Flavobacterium sp.]|nr:hypothetical protein [Flavobacterium sp.]
MKKYILLFIYIVSTTANSQIQIGQPFYGYNPYTFCGESIALSYNGSKIAIGKPSNINISSSNGLVSVYERNGNTWQALGNSISFGNGNGFGKTVALSSDGTILVVGAPYEKGVLGAINTGIVKTYQYSNGNWQPFGNTLEGSADSEFGSEVSLSSDGNTLAVSDVQNHTVKVFYRQSNVWYQIGFFSSQGSTLFGTAIALSPDGNVIALGSSSANNSTGLVRLYRKIANNNWQQIGQDILGDMPIDRLGTAVALNNDGSIVVVGIPKSDTNGIDSGKVKIFRNVNSNWIQIGNDILGEFTNDFLVKLFQSHLMEL